MPDTTSPSVLPGLSTDQVALLTQLVTGPSIRKSPPVRYNLP